MSTVPAGSFANAALVGANTVKGPGPCSVSTRPAAFTAATSVVWSLELTAFSMMFFEGYIGAPPTVTVCSFICASVGVAATAANASAAAATAVGRIVRLRVHVVSPSVAPRQRLANGDTERAKRGCSAGMGIFDRRGMPARGRSPLRRWQGRHRLVSLPLAMTGPVGWPVGEPPGGSSDTASVASGVTRPASSGGMVSRIGWPGWIRPSDCGRSRRRDQPQLHGARIVGQQRGRHDDQVVAVA